MHICCVRLLYSAGFVSTSRRDVGAAGLHVQCMNYCSPSSPGMRVPQCSAPAAKQHQAALLGATVRRKLKTRETSVPHPKSHHSGTLLCTRRRLVVPGKKSEATQKPALRTQVKSRQAADKQAQTGHECILPSVCWSASTPRASLKRPPSHACKQQRK